MKTKIIAVLIALVVMVSLGSAALVDYLSNTAVTDIEVGSPLEINETEYTLNNTYGGSVQNLSFGIENRANRNICGRVVTTVLYDGNLLPDSEGIDINGQMLFQGEDDCACECISAYTGYDGVYTWPCICFTAETVEVFDAAVVMHPALEPGHYIFSTTVMTYDCDCNYDEDTCTGEFDPEVCCEHTCGPVGCLCEDYWH